MKKTLLTLAAVAAVALTTFGQGQVQFNNLATGNAITIGSPSAPGQGSTGQYTGGNYLIQLVWAPGTLDQSQFDAAVKSSSAPVVFYGDTATGSPGSDGAGLFDGGILDLGAPGPYTMVAQAWFGSFATYALAAAGGANVGTSALFTASAAAAPNLPGDAFPASFTVQSVPEPGTLVLAGLGAASLLLFRRKK